MVSPERFSFISKTAIYSMKELYLSPLVSPNTALQEQDPKTLADLPLDFDQPWIVLPFLTKFMLLKQLAF